MTQRKRNVNATLVLSAQNVTTNMNRNEVYLHLPTDPVPWSLKISGRKVHSAMFVFRLSIM